jgi:hypothetical protein
MRQRWRLAEIRSEDYAFVLFSRFLNLLDARVRQSPLLCSAVPTIIRTLVQDTCFTFDAINSTR